MKSLEEQLGRVNPQKYSDLSIAYYFNENAKLGEEGQRTGIVPEKTYEQILEAS
jgi:hypothetical protein